MKRNVINLIYRILYQSKIKMLEHDEKNYQIYSQTIVGKSFDDYTKDLFLVIISEINLVQKLSILTNSEKLIHFCRMQAQCNLYEKELITIENAVLKMPSSDLKYYFKDEYKIVIENVQSMSINTITSLTNSCEERVSSGMLTRWKKNHLIRYLDTSLLMSAIDEIFPDSAK